jgi:hypothetical protein
MAEPIDPHADKTYRLRTVAEDGEVRETVITAGQALDFVAAYRATTRSEGLERGAVAALSHPVRDEQIVVEDDGTIVHRDSAVPEPPDEAA